MSIPENDLAEYNSTNYSVESFASSLFNQKYNQTEGMDWSLHEGRKAYVIAKFFQGGYRTKMKNWSENFSRASGAQKKGFTNFSPAPGFFSLWRH